MKKESYTPTEHGHIPTERSMLMDILVEADPEEVCSLLRLTSRDMMLAFPKKLESYIKSELKHLPDDLNNGRAEYEDEY